MSTGTFLLAAGFLLLYAGFLVWYGGRGKPMMPEEVEDLLAKLGQRAGREAQAEEPAVFNDFRTLAQSDDGREMVMVNFLKFRPTAVYPPGSPYDDNVMAANARYNRAVIPLLIKHGGHPLFVSQVQGRFLHPAGADDWDQIAMVRYRSRRDMLRMAADLAETGADIHKWAALEKTQVFPVKPQISLIFVRVMVAMLFFGLAMLLHWLLGGVSV